MKRPIAECVYPEIQSDGYSRVDGTVRFYQRVATLLDGATVVLDVGCGRGLRDEDPCEYRRQLQNLRLDGRRVIGIDVDAAGKDNPLINEFRLIEDIKHWPVDDASVNVVVADYVLEHVDDPVSFFREVARVIRPGGCFCARTPNAYGYVVWISRLIPNRMHAKVTGYAQADRAEADVFPTVYRCNTQSTLKRLLAEHGFDCDIDRIEGEPSYMAFSRIAYRVFAVIHRLLPPPLRSTLLVYARKTD